MMIFNMLGRRLTGYAPARLSVTATLTICAALAVTANAQEPPPETASLENAFKEDSFSPYANRNFPSQAFFGDTHVHSSVSMDAGAIGNRLGPDAAFRFARGEEVTSSTGVRAKLSRPLDFMVLSDHSDNMGLFTLLNDADPPRANLRLGVNRYRFSTPGRGTHAQ